MVIGSKYFTLSSAVVWNSLMQSESDHWLW